MINSSSARIEISPSNCFYSFGLITLANIAQTFATNYTLINNADSIQIITRRTQTASIPPSGTYSITYDNYTSNGIAWNASFNSDVMKIFPTLGQMKVISYPSCYGIFHGFTFLYGGPKSIFKISGTNLSGDIAYAKVYQIAKSSIKLSPIPGDMLQTCEYLPQITVKYFGIMAKCNGSCSVSLDSTLDSILTKVEALTSSYYNVQLKLSGNNFNTIQPVNNVISLTAIDGVTLYNCIVMAVYDTSSLTCNLTYLPFGTYLVQYLNTNVGYGNQTVTFIQPGIGNLLISPNKGSSSGGIMVNIMGDGFQSFGLSVKIGGQECQLRNITNTNIFCLVPPMIIGGSTIVDVEITQWNVKLALLNGFEYDNSLIATITQVSPNNNLNVNGNEKITIQGSQFGMNMNNVQVKIGNVSAYITSLSDNQIEINSPSMDYGQYPVSVILLNIGEAQPKDFTVIYLFQVISIFPNIGSFAGGTSISIKGKGFGNDSSVASVNLGSNSCSISFINDSALLCEASSLFTTQTISLIENPTGFLWSQESIIINQGDSVIWSWDSLYLVSITEVTALDNLTVLTNTPQVLVPVKTGSFLRYFSDIGIHAFATNVGGTTKVVAVRVQNREPVITDVYVNILTKEALQINTGQTFDPSCPISTTSMTPSGKFQYIYHSCHTHIVNNFSPILLETGQNLTITFQDQIQYLPRIVLSFNSTNINCLPWQIDNYTFSCCPNITLFSQIPPLLPVSVSVKFRHCGNALYNTNTYSPTLSIFPSPIITGIRPSYGSLFGGSTLTIDGYNLPVSELDKVMIGIYPCNVTNSSRERITCKTSPSNTNSTNNVNVYILSQAKSISCVKNCSFSYTSNDQLIVTSCTPSYVIDNFSLTISGSNFGIYKNPLSVIIGNYSCQINEVTDVQIKADCPNLPYGQNLVSLIHQEKGIYPTSCSIMSDKIIKMINPTKGSVEGGTILTIYGNGFKSGSTLVSLGSMICSIVTINESTIICITSANSQCFVNVSIKVDTTEYAPVTFIFDKSSTPVVTSISSTSLMFGDEVTLFGSGWNTQGARISVYIAGTVCNISLVNETMITFLTPDLDPGFYNVSLGIYNQGLASFQCNATVRIKLEITNIILNEGSLVGNQEVTINGFGFMQNNTNVYICDEICTNINIISKYNIICLTPQAFANSKIDVICDVVVKSGEESSVLKQAFSFKVSNTAVISSISPLTGGTAGGTILTIDGSGFMPSGNNVMIDGSLCKIITESEIEITCQTSRHQGSGKYKVDVYKGQYGLASGIILYFYVDRWSSKFTWNGTSLPQDGDLVVIQQGQTILLDTDTALLEMLLINGGKLIFDSTVPSLTLQSQYILINNGGSLEIGTESVPYENEARIILNGNYRSTELPIYGVKMIAVRNGTLDLHGKYINVPWTKLAKTFEAGSIEIELLQPVDWKVGDSIIIATTGDRNSQEETEEHIIKGINDDNTIITLDSPLKYKKLGGIVPDTSPTGLDVFIGAEVGLLTRNIRIEGSSDIIMTVDIPACPAGFDTGEFAVQTCFQGRFGEEMGSDEFGGHIIAHPPTMDSGVAVMRISGVELYYMGQSFRLGRYPIHFHLGGDMTGSYVKRVSVHKTFNRALVIHGSHNILVEFSIFYDVKGGAIFLEDGIEHGNTLQYNLIVKVLQSTSLLNDDITPASFWATNPNNTYIHNAAVGGSHFGNWFRMHDHPDAASYDPNICPKQIPLGQFKNNSAHSFGWYGLWIFPDMFPTLNGACNSNSWIPALFEDFLSWNNNKGVECVNCGSIQFNGFVIMNNENAGIEGKLLMNTYEFSTSSGPILKNILIVGNEPLLRSDNEYCTNTGLVLPWSNGLMVSNVLFKNFNMSSCTPISATSIQGKCTIGCGGWTTQFEKISFENSISKIDFRWQSDFIIIDTDGSTYGMAPGTSLVPWFNVYPRPECTEDNSQIFTQGVSGGFCIPSVKFNRWAATSTQISIQSRNIRIYSQSQNIQYNDTILFLSKRLTTKNGWMASLPVNRTYLLEFIGFENIQNISYTATMHRMNPRDWIIFNHRVSTAPDRMINGKALNGSIDPSSDSHFSFYFNNDTGILEFLVKNDQLMISDLAYNVNFFKCFWVNCTAPNGTDGQMNPSTDGTQTEIIWSDNEPPTGCEINATTYVKANFSYSDNCDVLTVRGVLEFITPNTASKATILNVRIILIINGRILAGNASNSYSGNLNINLRGSINDKEYPAMNSPPIGNKAIAVFGDLCLFGQVSSVAWSTLNRTALAGDKIIYINDPVFWQPGNELVLTTTQYNHQKNEVVKIVSVDNIAGSVQLESAVQFNHYVGTVYLSDNKTLTISAEVGLLDRNIIISSDSESSATYESFGGRIFASKLMDGMFYYSGSIQLFGVGLKNMGQFGYIEQTDARFALSFISLGNVNSGRISFVRQCSFYNSYSPAVGAFDTNGLILDSNVIYKTQGEGIILSGSNHIIQNNLIIEVNWDGGHYRPMLGPSSISNRIIWTAGLDVSAVDLSSGTIIGNHVAGSERTGIRLNDIDCSNNNLIMHDNVIHSVLIGIYLESPNSQTGCNKITGVFVYRAFDFGIFYEQAKSILVNNITLSDNGIGIATLVLAPPALSHMLSYKFFNFTNSVVIGKSGFLDCIDNVDSLVLTPSANSRSFRTDSGGNFGILTSIFMSSHNEAPVKPFNNLMSYNTIGGKTVLKNVEFVNFNEICNGIKDVAFATNSASDDGIQPSYLQDLIFTNTPLSQRVFIHRPNLAKINPADCVDMDCDGLKKVLFIDKTGSINGTVMEIFSQSEWQWNGDPRRGLGDYRIPPDMLLTSTNIKLDPGVKYPNKGIVRNINCSFNPDWNAYYCPNSKYEMLIIESMDSDTETRRLSPVAIATDDGNNNFVDLINGPQDHGWCSGYTCQTRISTFLAIVPQQRNLALYFTSTSPQQLRLRFVNTDSKTASVRVGIYYSFGGKFDIYNNNQYVTPLNGYYSNQQLLLKSPSTPTEFMPDAISGNSGDNYYDINDKIQYVIVQGSSFVDIKSSPMIQLGFNLPSVSVDQFFGSNIINYLAAFLQIPINKIRVVSVVPETTNSGRRKRSISAGSVVQLEIGYTTSANGSASSNNVTLQISYLNGLTDQIKISIQTGDLSKALQVTMTNIAVAAPLPDPSTSTWASLTLSLVTPITPSVIQVPVIYKATTVGNTEEGQSIAIQVEALDTQGSHVNSLSTSTIKYKAIMTTSNPSSTATVFSAVSYFGINDSGWAYFKSIFLDYAGYPYNINIDIYTDDGITSTRRNGLQFSLDISLRVFSLNILNFPSTIYPLNNNLALNVQVINNKTMQGATSLNWNNHQWQIRASVCVQIGPSATSWISDIVSVIPSGNNFVTLPNILVKREGAYRICLSLELNNKLNRKAYYLVNVLSPTLLVRQSMYTIPDNKFKKTIKLVFGNSDFSKIQNQTGMFETTIFNKIHFDLFGSYISVLSTSYVSSKGSINTNFDAFSSGEIALNDFLSGFQAAVTNGYMKITFNNEDFQATSVAFSDIQNGVETNNQTLMFSLVGSLVIILLIVTVVLSVVFIRRAKNKLRIVDMETKSDEDIYTKKIKIFLEEK